MVASLSTSGAKKAQLEKQERGIFKRMIKRSPSGASPLQMSNRERGRAADADAEEQPSNLAEEASGTSLRDPIQMLTKTCHPMEIALLYLRVRRAPPP